MAALAQGDDKLRCPYQQPRQRGLEIQGSQTKGHGGPTLGDPERRAILMEAVGAVAYLMSGSNILIMRHPEAVRW